MQNKICMEHYKYLAIIGYYIYPPFNSIVYSCNLQAIACIR